MKPVRQLVVKLEQNLIIRFKLKEVTAQQVELLDVEQQLALFA